jgi:nitrate reductase cytochrome c-type subunit
VRRQAGTHLRGAGAALAALFAASLAACGAGGEERVAVPGRAGAFKTAAALRAERRAYDGAPPVIPHGNLGMACMNCHTERGLDLPGVGFAPPMPHERTPGLSALARCTQCHVARETGAEFRGNDFRGLRQDLRAGRRMHAFAPPVLPHPVFMRENCLACHDGPAAREEIRCTHPDRVRCLQCHVPSSGAPPFSR